MHVFLLVKVKESYTMEGNVGRTLVEQRERESLLVRPILKLG
jgi:hypothetical protein